MTGVAIHVGPEPRAVVREGGRHPGGASRLHMPVNDPPGRITKEIRRRTRVVGAFPDGQSCLNLAATRLRYIGGAAWSAKFYMNMRLLCQPQVMQTKPSPNQMCERFWTPIPDLRSGHAHHEINRASALLALMPRRESRAKRTAKISMSKLW